MRPDVSSRPVTPSEEALAGSFEGYDLLIVQIEPAYSHTSFSTMIATSNNITVNRELLLETHRVLLKSAVF